MPIGSLWPPLNGPCVITVGVTSHASSPLLSGANRRTREATIAENAHLLAAELGLPLDRPTPMVTAFTAALPRWW